MHILVFHDLMKISDMLDVENLSFYLKARQGQGTGLFLKIIKHEIFCNKEDYGLLTENSSLIVQCRITMRQKMHSPKRKDKFKKN